MPAATPAENPPKPVRTGSLWAGKRLYIAIFLFFNLFINYMDRINLSLAAPAIAKEFGWNPGTMGLIFSAFIWSYCFCIIPWGWMSDRIGTRMVNGFSITIWSIGAMLTGAATGLGTMLAARLALGVGEAASVPASAKVVRQWFPPGERGLATAIFNGGTFAGPAISAPAIAWLVLHTGWRISFVVAGALGIVWVLLWMKIFRVPSECSWLPHEERAYILAETGGHAAVAPPPKGAVLRLLRKKTMWGLFLTEGCIAYTMLMFLFWLPSYLVHTRHMDLMKASWFTGIPYLVAAVAGLFVGRFSDARLTHAAVKQGKRRTLLIVFILLSTSVLLTNAVRNEFLVLILISLLLTFIGTAVTLNIALSSDLVWNPNMVGTAMGIAILGGISFGAVAPIVTGYIVKSTGSFDGAFYVAGGLLFVGALIAFTMTRQPIHFAEEDPASASAGVDV
jgi:ACS family glucarate transporter-like MFS transporter